MAEHDTAVAPDVEQAVPASSPAGPGGSLLHAPLSPQGLLGLQRAAGNRAVGRMLQRQSADEAEAQRIAELRRKLDDAIKYEHWREAATYLNGFSPQDIETTLGRLNGVQKSALYQGATSPDGPGEDSNVAHATRAFYLDGEIFKAMVSSQWGWAAKYLNGFSEPDLRQRLNGFKASEIQQIHDAAQTTPGVGPDSAVSKLSAEVLVQRKNTPLPASERLAEQLYEALSDGIKRSDPKTLEAAKQLAVMFYEVRAGAHGEVSVTVNVTNLRSVAKRIGISPDGLEKCVTLVRPFAPKDKRLYIDYAGRIGTQENLAEREQADKLKAISEADTTLGSLLMSYVAARGGNAAEMRAANEFGSNLQAFASTMPVAGSNSPAHSSVEEPNRTGAEVRPKDPATQAPGPPPAPPAGGGGGGPPPSSPGPAPANEPPAPAKPKAKPFDPVPRPLAGGGGGNKTASAQAAGEKSDEVKGFAGGPVGERKSEIESAQNRAPQANIGENRTAAALNKSMGPTVRSPENVKEYAAQLENAKARDGLEAGKNPDLLVRGPAGWQCWDVRTMEGGTASVDSAIKAAGGKASDGQSVRIAINIDGVSNDGAEFAQQMREGIKADRRKPPVERESSSLKAVVLIKNGRVIPVLSD